MSETPVYYDPANRLMLALRDCLSCEVDEVTGNPLSRFPLKSADDAATGRPVPVFRDVRITAIPQVVDAYPAAQIAAGSVENDTTGEVETQVWIILWTDDVDPETGMMQLRELAMQLIAHLGKHKHLMATGVRWKNAWECDPGYGQLSGDEGKPTGTRQWLTVTINPVWMEK